MALVAENNVTLTHPSGTGIRSSGEGTLVSGNRITSAYRGAQVYGACSGTVFRGNTAAVSGASAQAAFETESVTGTGALIANNIFTSSGTVILSYTSGVNFTYANNTLISPSGVLASLSSTSSGNTFYWNNFTATSGQYVSDANGGNLYNATAALPANATGLIGYWKMDEGGGTAVRDWSPSANDGALVNSPSWAAGVAGRAINFTGGNYAIIGNGSIFNPQYITVSAWVNFNSCGGRFGQIVGKGADNDWQLRMGGDSSACKPVFGVQASGFPQVTGPLLQNGTWYHLAGTYDGAYLRLYVNGAEVANGTSSGAIAAGTLPVSIGSRTHDGTTYGYPFYGAVDEVRVYSRSLSASEVLADYSALRNEGNIYANVMDSTVEIFGVNPSLGYPTLYVGVGGDGYPYSAATSAGKVTGSVYDWAPLTARPAQGCGILGTANTLYKVIFDLSSNGTCFTATAPNVTLDCQGRTITGSNITDTYGVYSNQQGTVVRNCRIFNYEDGIHYSGVAGGIMGNNTLGTTHNSGSGIYATGGSGISAANNTANSTLTSAIYFTNSPYAVLENNTAGANYDALPAILNYPYGVALGPDGYLYFADSSNHMIRKVDLATNQTYFVAGNLTPGYAEGVGAAARFYNPYDVAFGPDGYLYVADYSNCRIRKVNVATGQTSLVVGTGSCGYTEGTQANARVYAIGLSFGPDGYLYFADYGNHRIRKVNVTSTQTYLVAGSGSAAYLEGVGAAAKFYYPYRVHAADDGYLYVSDTYNNRIRKINLATNETSLVSGSGTAGYLEGSRDVARFNLPMGIAMSGGMLYVADYSNCRIRRVDPSTGQTALVAGTGSCGFTDGASNVARFNSPLGAFASGGLLYISDGSNSRLRAINLTTNYTTRIAGTGTGGYLEGMGYPPASSGHGIYLYASSSNSRLTNNTGFSSSNSGISAELCSSCSNTTLEGNNGTSISGFGIYSYVRYNGTIIDNTGSSQAGYGIYAYSDGTGSSSLVARNNGTSLTDPGMYAYFMDSSIINNTGTSFSDVGFYPSTCYRSNLTGNLGTSLTSHGIQFYNGANTTFANNTGISTYSVGISTYYALTSRIINNTGTSLYSHGLYAYNSSGNLYEGNWFNSSSGYGAYVRTYSYFNNFTRNTLSSYSSYGLGQYYIYNNTFANNNISSYSSYAIRFNTNTQGNAYVNNSISSTTGYAVLLNSGTNSVFNRFTGNNVSGRMGFYVRTANNTFDYNDVRSSTSYGAVYMDGGGNGNRFIGNLFSGTGVRAVEFATGTNTGNLFVNNTFTSSSTSQPLIYINAQSGANTFCWNNFTDSAGYYVQDLSGFNLYNASECNGEGNIWHNVMNGSVDIAGTSQSSGYPFLYVGTAGEGYPYGGPTAQGKIVGAIDYAPLVPHSAPGCEVITVPGTVHRLVFNLSSSGTCIVVAAANVTVDCRGRSITGSNQTSSYGVYSNQFNTTVKDCVITNYHYPIYYSGATYGLLQNDTLASTHASGSGLFLENAGHNNILYVRANAAPGAWGGAAMRVSGSGNNSITSSNATVSGASSIPAIWLQGSSHNNTISRARANASAVASDGLGLLAQNAYGTGILNSTISGSRGIAIASGSTGTRIADSTGIGASSYGIGFEQSSNHGSVIGSNGTSSSGIGIRIDGSSYINATNSRGASASYRGVELSGGATFNRLTNVSGTSLGSDIGIDVLSSHNNTLDGCTGTSEGWAGIALSYANGNNVTNSRGASTGMAGIQLYGADGNSLSGVNGTVSGASGYGIYATAGSDYNAIDRAIGSTNSTVWNHAAIMVESSSHNNISNSAGNYTGNSSGVRGIELYNGASFNRLVNCTAGAPLNFALLLYASANNNTVVGSTAMGTYGISIYGSANYNSLYNNTARGSSAIFIYGASHNSLWNTSAFSPNGYAAFLTAGASGNAISGGTLNSTSSSAVYINAQSNSNNISGNAIIAPAGIGAAAYNSTGNRISGNAISSGSHGVYLDQLAHSNAVSGNTISSTGHGVFAELCNAGAISQNTIVAPGASHGIYVLSGTGHSISGNNVTVASGRGIYLSYSTYTAGNNAVSDNHASSGGAGTGISVENTGLNTFANNTGESGTGYGIYLAGSTLNTFSRDSGSSGSDAGIYLVNSPSNTFSNATGFTSSGKGMHIRLGSDGNSIIDSSFTATSAGTAILVEGSSGSNITGTNATARDGDAILLSTGATDSIIERAGAVSVSGAGISVSASATGTAITNSTASSTSSSGILVAAAHTNITLSFASASSGGATESCGARIDGASDVRISESSFFAAAGASLCLESGSHANYVYDNALYTTSGSGNLLRVAAGAYGNTFYWNVFGPTAGKYAIDEGSGNVYNITLSGQGEGNSWHNLAATGEVDICGSRHTLHPGWTYYVGGSSNAEPSEYPYNPQNSKTRVSGGVVDYAPMTSQRCAPPPPQPSQNYTESATCEQKPCGIDSDCMGGQAPYCDAGCNPFTNTCYPCVSCDSAYCLPQGSVCGNVRVLEGCGDAACNAGVCTSSGEICPGTPLLGCCPSTYCSSGRCVPKLSAGQQCTNSSQCQPSAPYCAGSVCSACIPANSATPCTSSSDCCPYAGNLSGVCNLAPGTSGYATCLSCLPEGGRSCASSSECCGGLVCKEGACAENTPPSVPAAPVIALSAANATEGALCVQNCPASNMPTDPDRDTPVRIEYKWQVGSENATSFWHQSSTFNCEQLPGGCQGQQIILMARACDPYGSCSGAASSAPITPSANIAPSCSVSSCSPADRCCMGRVCKYSSAGAQSGSCCISDPTLACTADGDCCSGKCRANSQGAMVCVGALACGQACTLASDCPQGCPFCAQGTCRACIPAGSSASCTDSAQCCAVPGRSSGICDLDASSGAYGRCVAGLATGVLCTSDSECLSGRCQPSGNTSAKKCAPAALSCSYKGGACIDDSGCCSGFCDRLNSAGPISVASYGSNNTLVLDYGQCTDTFAPFTKCDTPSNPQHPCADGYPCTEYAGTGVHYCTGGYGTQFNGWVKAGGVNFERTPNARTGSSAAVIYGLPASYAYNSVLMNALEGGRNYMLGFWAQATVAGTLARYAVFDTVNNAYLSGSGGWLYASGQDVPEGGIIVPTTAQTGAWKQVVKVFRTLPNAKLQLRFYPISQGTSYYIDDVDVSQANDFSMLAWLRADSAQPGGPVISQVSSLGSGVRQGINWSIDAGNNLYLNMYSSGTQLPAGPTALSPSVFVGDGKWHQVALSVDRMGNYSVYLDGALAHSAPFTLGALNSSSTLYIGGTGTGSGFSGELGEVRFYKRALTPSDMAGHYAGWYQQQCSIDLSIRYDSPAAQNMTVAYNADLRIRKLLPETVLSMPFDINTTSDAQGMVTDYSRFLGHGTKTGAAWAQGGAVGGAYEFNTGGRTTDRILLPSPLLSGTGDFTLSAWIYPTNSVTPPNYIMGNYGIGNSGGVEFYVYQGKLGIYINGYLSSVSGIPLNQWTHVAAVRSGGTVRLYINGVLDQSGQLPASITAGRNFAIGNGPDYVSEKFVGRIDEVRVFNSALSPEDIAALYADTGLLSSLALPVSQK